MILHRGKRERERERKRKGEEREREREREGEGEEERKLGEILGRGREKEREDWERDSCTHLHTLFSLTPLAVVLGLGPTLTRGPKLLIIANPSHCA
jgi:hypothetical protein